MEPLLFVGPVIAFAAGFLVKRKSVILGCTLVAIVVSLSGWIFGWAGDSDTPTLGGAIIFALYFGMPFVGAAYIGVLLAHYWDRQGGRTDQLIEVRLDIPPDQRPPVKQP